MSKGIGSSTVLLDPQVAPLVVGLLEIARNVVTEITQHPEHAAELGHVANAIWNLVRETSEAAVAPALLRMEMNKGIGRSVRYLSPEEVTEVERRLASGKRINPRIRLQLSLGPTVPFESLQEQIARDPAPVGARYVEIVNSEL